MTPPAPLTPPSAEEVCRCFTPSADARALLQLGVRPRAFLDGLVHKGLFPDALTFAAFWLTKRQAVWWGCLCAWHAGRPRLKPPAAAALRAALSWVHEPSEEHRRAAGKAGDAAGGAATPAGAVALAAFWSEGSLSAPDLPPAPPPPGLTQQTVGGAVLLAANLGPPDQLADRCRGYVNLALEVHQGQVDWAG